MTKAVLLADADPLKKTVLASSYRSEISGVVHASVSGIFRATAVCRSEADCAFEAYDIGRSHEWHLDFTNSFDYAAQAQGDARRERDWGKKAKTALGNQAPSRKTRGTLG